MWVCFKFYSPFHSILCLGSERGGSGYGHFPGPPGKGTRGHRPPPRACPCRCGAALCQDPLRQRPPAAVSPNPLSFKARTGRGGASPRPRRPPLGTPLGGDFRPHARAWPARGAQVPGGRSLCACNSRPGQQGAAWARASPACGGLGRFPSHSGCFSHFLQTAHQVTADKAAL